MANIVIMPKQGLQMTEGYITKWLKAEGDSVTEGEPLFEMETDKLTITIDSSFSGTLLKIIRGEGEQVPITEPIGVIGEAGEDISGLDVAAGAKMQVNDVPPIVRPEPQSETQSETQPAPVAVAANEAPAMEEKTAFKAPQGRVFITPRAKMRCMERGITDYTKIPGTGGDGLIIERDVLNYKISETTVASCSRMSIKVCVDAAMQYSKQAQENGIDFSVDAIIAKAACVAAKKYPEFSQVRVTSVCTTEVEEYFAALQTDENIVISVGGIFKSEGKQITIVSVGFNEYNVDAQIVAEYLTYLKKLIENPIVTVII